ncbi:hypothetical protein E4U42_001060 [Claviceps africana]|uniref:Uncharacterized protein n=1 Tax=Claviceps africana TaxID=83212 RepID=A0A8K0JFK9_9HYPO|nr:hypothetical protein E4U42_001060 [Claviceps africana]
MKSSVFVTLLGVGLASAVDCPASGQLDDQHRTGCSTTETYPDGETCQRIDGCYLLVDSFEKPIIGKPVDDSLLRRATSECPPPGNYDHQGRYSCNPAHAYPNGQKCKPVADCFFLTDADSNLILEKPTSTTPAGSAATPSCPAPGSYDSQGRYSCNPAHTYPGNQTCKTVDGCLFLVDADGKPIISATKATGAGAAQPSGTGACPAPGSYDSQGRYSCNPAHEYPNGQTCGTLFNGCYFLCGPDGQPIRATGTMVPVPTATSGATTLGSGAGGILALVAAAAALL